MIRRLGMIACVVMSVIFYSTSIFMLVGAIVVLGGSVLTGSIYINDFAVILGFSVALALSAVSFVIASLSWAGFMSLRDPPAEARGFEVVPPSTR